MRTCEIYIGNEEEWKLEALPRKVSRLLIYGDNPTYVTLMERICIRQVRAISRARPEGAQRASKRGMSLAQRTPSCFEGKEGVWVQGIHLTPL